jgi:HSP20 family protein
VATRSEETKGKEQKGGQQGQSKAAGGAMAPSRRNGLAPYGGFEPFYRLREEFDRLLDRFIPGWPGPWEPWEGGRRDGWGLDVQEDDGTVTVRAEAPGFEPSEFDIQVRGDQLVLHAAHKAEAEETERGYREWRRQEFYRSVPLPAGVDPDKVEATYRNGVLSVTVPKTEQGKGRRVEVKT